MTIVERSALVPHSAAEMFDLVDRVEDYPEFLPWCGGTVLHQRTATMTVATIRINYHGIKAQFSTENEKRPSTVMTMRLREGPFRHLKGDWHFTALSDTACKVEFRIDYEFSSKLLERTLGIAFNKIISAFVESFVKRASQVYATG